MNALFPNQPGGTFGRSKPDTIRARTAAWVFFSDGLLDKHEHGAERQPGQSPEAFEEFADTAALSISDVLA
jgi:hypothetical protein